MQVRVICAAIAMTLTAAMVTSRAAHANASCTVLVTNTVNKLTQSGGAYRFEMTIHRTDIGLVTYSSGDLSKTGSPSWPLSGSSNQLFSDRFSSNQPFNINAADSLTPWISSTGQLYIWYNNWGFSTQWDMGCTGNTFTAIVPNYGVVTLTLRYWWTIG
jgi:hypothetical protein